MKKNVLALSIATMIGGLGFSGVASAALEVNESGTGHIVVVPYFTAQGGNATGIHLTNTDMTNAKAVKVRIRGASNSDDLLDFQVFLSPGDVWTASISADEDGLAQLTTNDTSCTVPEAVRVNKTTKFGKARLKAGADNSETREGYIEILNMADIPPAVGSSWTVSGSPAAVTAATTVSPLYTAIKHVSVDNVQKAPCTSAVLTALESVNPGNNQLDDSTAVGTGAGEVNAANVGTFAQSLGMRAPTGKLAANWYVINVANSTTFSGAATAIVATAADQLIYSPQLAEAKTGTTNLFTADPLMVSGVMDTVPYDLPDLSTPLEVAGTQAAASAQAAELTSILAQKTVLNQYLVDANLGAATDWVLSMPTRRYIVAANYAATKTDTFGLADGATAVVAPATTMGLIAADATGTFTGAKVVAAADAKNTADAYRIYNLLSTGNVANGTTAGAATATTDFGLSARSATVNSKGQICAASVKQTFLDNEESQKAGSGAVVSPSPAVVALQACGEVSVITLGQGTSAASVVGASVAQSNVAPGYLGGWGSVDFTKGVPVLGAAFIKAVNANASAGMMGNYGLTWAHTYVKN